MAYTRNRAVGGYKNKGEVGATPVDKAEFENFDSGLSLVSGVVSGAGPGLDLYGSAANTHFRSSNVMPGIVSLISGTDDETPILSNCTVAADTTNFKVGDRGVAMTSVAAGFMNYSLDPISPTTGTTSPLVVPPWQALCAWIYIPDVTKLVTNDVTLFLYTDDALTAGNRWSKNCTQFGQQTLVNGWNLIRVPANAGYLNTTRRGFPTSPTTIYRVTVSVDTNAIGAQTTIGHVWLETRPKASVLVVTDRGYTTFLNNAYPALKAAGIPVTWAIDTTLMGTGTGDTAVLTQNQLDTVANENRNSVSFHGYDGSPTSGMTAAQLRADTAKAIKFCQAKGYTGRMWRAAFVQGNAPQYQAIKNYVIGGASGLSADADLWNAWPPSPDGAGTDLMRISRRAIDDAAAGTAHRTTADLDSYFQFLQQTNGLDVYFLHGVGGSQAFDTSQSLFNYWLGLVTAGIAAGWLEAVTFEDLFYRAGGSFANLTGAAMATYLDAAGNRVTKNTL